MSSFKVLYRSSFVLCRLQRYLKRAFTCENANNLLFTVKNVKKVHMAKKWHRVHSVVVLRLVTRLKINLMIRKCSEIFFAVVFMLKLITIKLDEFFADL